jgi:hypothetical protein
MGNDWEDVYEALAREKAMREKLDLPEPAIMQPPKTQPLDEGETEPAAPPAKKKPAPGKK